MTHDEIEKLFESHFGNEEMGADAPNLLGNVSSAPAPSAAATGSGQSGTTHQGTIQGAILPPSSASAPLPSTPPLSGGAPKISGPPLVTPTPTSAPTPEELAQINPATRGSYLKNHNWWIEAAVASRIGIVTYKVVHHPKIGVFSPPSHPSARSSITRRE